MRFSIIAMLFAVLAGCSSYQSPQDISQPPEFTTVPELQLPATYTGVIGCNDCDRLEVLLNLREDNLYQLRRTYYLGDKVRNVDAKMNRWHYLPQENTIVLESERGELKNLVLKDDGRLRIVQSANLPSVEGEGDELLRRELISDFPDIVPMRGMFRVRDGRAEITECLSDGTYNIARGGDLARTARLYGAIPHGYGASMLLNFNGSLQRVDPFLKESEEITLSAFGGFDVSKNCQGETIRATLTGTPWRLQEVEGEEVVVGEDGQVPYFIMEDDRTFVGSGGCNDFTGRYSVRGLLLQLTLTQKPRFACFSGLRTENSFYDVMNATSSFEIEGATLRLLDESGAVKAILITALL